MTQPPVPKSADFDRLIRLMLMTTSQHDGEALNAMRAANAWLRKGGLDWEAVLKGKVTIMADPFAGLDAPPTAERSADYGMQQPRGYAPPPPPPPRPTPRPQAPPQPMRSTYGFHQAQAQAARQAPPPPKQTRQRRTTLADLGLD